MEESRPTLGVTRFVTRGDTHKYINIYILGERVNEDKERRGCLRVLKIRFLTLISVFFFFLSSPNAQGFERLGAPDAADSYHIKVADTKATSKRKRSRLTSRLCWRSGEEEKEEKEDVCAP